MCRAAGPRAGHAAKGSRPLTSQFAREQAPDLKAGLRRWRGDGVGLADAKGERDRDRDVVGEDEGGWEGGRERLKAKKNERDIEVEGRRGEREREIDRERNRKRQTETETEIENADREGGRQRKKDRLGDRDRQIDRDRQRLREGGREGGREGERDTDRQEEAGRGREDTDSACSGPPDSDVPCPSTAHPPRVHRPSPIRLSASPRACVRVARQNRHATFEAGLRQWRCECVGVCLRMGSAACVCIASE